MKMDRIDYIVSKVINEAFSEGKRPRIKDSSMPIFSTSKQQSAIPSRKPKQKQPPIDYDKVELGVDPKVRSGEDWYKNGGNFPVKRAGRTYYVSRSCVVSMKCFCKNSEGEWCILANQRGQGTTNSGAWNTPVGYLDYDESLEEAAARETWEETGVKVPLDKIEFMGKDSAPSGRRQDVVFRFKAVLDGVTDDYPTNADNSEPGEVDDIQWIPLSQVKNGYRWNGDAQLYHASMALGDYMNGGDGKMQSLINELKREIGSNQKAQYLLNKILTMNK